MGRKRTSGLVKVVMGLGLLMFSNFVNKGNAQDYNQRRARPPVSAPLENDVAGMGNYNQRGPPMWPGSASTSLDNAVVRPGDTTSYVASINTAGSDVLGPVPLVIYTGEGQLAWMETTPEDVDIFDDAGIYTIESIFVGENVGPSTIIDENLAQVAIPVSLPNNIGLDQPSGNIARITFRVPEGTLPGNYLVRGEFGYSYFIPEFPFFITATLLNEQITFDTLTVLRTLGDMTGNGSVGMEDVSPFTDVLTGNNTDPSDIDTADMNRDGSANGLDVQLFVDALTGN